jgi:hypothetical protein
VPDVEPLTDGERGWVRANLDALEAAGVDVHDPRSLGSFYDQEFLAWSALPDDARPDPNPIVNMIGIGLGECLNARIGSSWMIAAYPTAELVIHRAANNVVIHPPNMVGKRWSDGTVGFLPDLVDAVVERLAAL